MPIHQVSLDLVLKKIGKHSHHSKKEKVSSSAQIQQKMQKLKEILNKENLTNRTNKNSAISSGSIVSRKNRIQVIADSHSIKTYLQSQSSKFSKNSDIKVDSSKQSPDPKHKKKSKKILSYLESSQEFEQLQKRLQKFKPFKINEDHQKQNKISSLKDIFIEDFIVDRHLSHRLGMESTEIASQLLPNDTQSFSLLKTQKLSLTNTQPFTITEPSELHSSILPLQSKCIQRNLAFERKNFSCLSDFSNFSNFYLKPIHEEQIWNSKQGHHRKNKQKQKPMMSFSLLLSRRNKNQSKMVSVKLGDQMKYDNWLKIKKSKVNRSKKTQKPLNHKSVQRNKSKEIQRIGLKEKSSNRRQSRSTIKRNQKGRSLSSCFKSKIEDEIIESGNKKAGMRLTLAQDMKESPITAKKKFNNLKEELDKNKKSGADLMGKVQPLDKSKSENYLHKLSNLVKKGHPKDQQQSQSIETCRQNAIKELHRKYEIEQLSMRLRGQLKKITSALKENGTGRKQSRKDSGNKHKNNSSSKKSCRQLDGIRISKQLEEKVIELKLNVQAVKIKHESMKKQSRQNQLCLKTYEEFMRNDRQKLYRLSLQDVKQGERSSFFPDKEQETNFNIIDKQQATNQQEVIVIGENQFDESPSKSIDQGFDHQFQLIEASPFYVQEANEPKGCIQEKIQPETSVNDDLSLNQTTIPQKEQFYSQNTSSVTHQDQSHHKTKTFQVDIKKPDQLYYNDLDNDFIFKNRSYQQFIQIYSNLLIQVAHYCPQHDIGRNESELIKNICKPLGTPALHLLRMMAQNSRNFGKTSSINFRSIEGSNKQRQSEQLINQIDSCLRDQFQHSEPMLLSSNKKNCSQKDQKMTDTQQINSQYIVSPQVYYKIESNLVDYLLNFDGNNLDRLNPDMADSDEATQKITHSNHFQSLINLILTMHSNAKQNCVSPPDNQTQDISFPQSIVDFYEQHLRTYSLAVFDLTNSILDQLRPFGSKGLPPIYFSKKPQPKFVSSDSIQQFLYQKFNLEIFTIKLGLIVDNIESKKSLYSQKILKDQLNTKELDHERQKTNENNQAIPLTFENGSNQTENIKTQKLGQVIKKYLQKQAQIINKQLQSQYSYLQDVKFQILYDIWTQIQSLIIKEETQVLINFIF